MQAALLKDLAEGFVTNRMAVARAIREMYQQDPAGFADAAVDLLRENPAQAGPKFLLALLLAQPDGLTLICDPDRFTPEQSLALVQQAKTLDANVEVRLAKIFNGPLTTDRQANLATRVLDILDRSADPMTILPALRQLLQCPNARVRSKAALLIGRISRNPQWAKLSDPLQDQRVVANAIESLWGLDSTAAKAAFREAAGDPRNRVAGNGAIGLYIAGDPHGITSLLRLARHEDPIFRATAAWAMGRSGDPRFLVHLEVLVADADEMVRKAAAKAKFRIAERVAKLRENPPIPLQIRTAKWHEGEHELHVRVGDGSASTCGFSALQFVIWNGSVLVEEFSFHEEHNGPEVLYRLGWPGPLSDTRHVTVEFFGANACGSDSGLELFF